MTNTKFLLKLNRGGSFVFVQRLDRTPVQTTSNQKVALIMGRLTAEDAVKSLQSSRSTGGVSTHMRYKQPLKQILIATRSYWDRPETRAAVRQSFDKVIQCGTLALGAEVFETLRKQLFESP